MKRWRLFQLATLMAAGYLAAPQTVEALNGLYFASHGVKSTAMGGVAVALPQDTLGALTNPANLSFLGQRLDGSIGYYYANGERDVTQRTLADDFFFKFDGKLNTHEHNPFGEGGYNHPCGDTVTLGVTLAPLYGGWMHNEKVSAAFAGDTDRPKISSYFIGLTPNIAVRVLDSLAIGLGVDLVMGRMNWTHGAPREFNNVNAPVFAPEVSKWDTAFGTAVRGGLLWEAVKDTLFLGFAGQTPTYMQRFSKYRELIQNDIEVRPFMNPEVDRINGPALVNAGLAWWVLQSTALATDVGYVLNKGVEPWRTMPWRNQVFVKAGVSHQFNDNWAGRFGFNWYQNPWKTNTALQSRIVPRVQIAPIFVQWRIAAGGSYRCNSGGEWTLCYELGVPDELKIDARAINSITLIDGGTVKGKFTAQTHRVTLGYQLEL